jgi:hypothetical protein
MVSAISFPHAVVVERVKIFTRQLIDPLLINQDGLCKPRDKVLDIVVTKRLRQLPRFGFAAFDHFEKVHLRRVLSHLASPVPKFGLPTAMV